VIWSIDRHGATTASRGLGPGWRSTSPPTSAARPPLRRPPALHTAGDVDELVRDRRRSATRPSRLADVPRTLGASAARPAAVPPEVVLAEALRRRGVRSSPDAVVGRPTVGRCASTSPSRPSAGASSSTSTRAPQLDGHAADADGGASCHRLAWQIETVSEHDMRDPDGLAAISRALRRHARLADHPSAS
jgi:hypothetical protein